ncbi:MAG: RNA polymerase sigma factor [Opitutaceae bacterium]
MTPHPPDQIPPHAPSRRLGLPNENLTRWFLEEVQPHEPGVRSYLRSSLPAIRDVDDVVQEAYLRIWKTRTTQSITSARAFLFTVARRVALNLIRKERNSPFVDYRDFDASRVLEDKPDACDALILQERIDLLADALMSLPPRCRDVVILHKVKGLSQHEVAAQLGVSERTVEAHVRTGVARCLAYLKTKGFCNYRHDEP